MIEMSYNEQREQDRKFVKYIGKKYARLCKMFFNNQVFYLDRSRSFFLTFSRFMGASGINILKAGQRDKSSESGIIPPKAGRLECVGYI